MNDHADTLRKMRREWIGESIESPTANEGLQALDAAIAALEAGRSGGSLADAANLYQQETGQELDPRAFCRAVELVAAGRSADWVLPCDVRLPPATTINAGCKLSTLLHAMECRKEACVVHFPPKAAPQQGVTEDAVTRAMLAYEAEVDGDVYSPQVPRTAMRAALAAALSHQQPVPSVSGDMSFGGYRFNKIEVPGGLAIDADALADGVLRMVPAPVSEPAYTKADDLLHTIGGVEHPDAASDDRPASMYGLVNLREGGSAKCDTSMIGMNTPDAASGEGEDG